MENPTVGLFDGVIETLSRALDLRARNHEVILNNVANADTPDYKPFALQVEEVLKQEGQAGGGMDHRLHRTDGRHLEPLVDPFDSDAPLQRGQDNPLLLRGDGNGVDIDAEMTALAKNSLLYKASAQIAASKFRGLKNVIGGGNR